MDKMQYLDFDLEIEPAAQGYRVEVNGPAGQSSGTFSLPFSTPRPAMEEYRCERTP